MSAEFGHILNSIDVDEVLSKHGPRWDDGWMFSDYEKILSKAKIEGAAINQYVIQGKKDNIYKKTSFYSCNDLREFQSKLKMYE